MRHPGRFHGTLIVGALGFGLLTTSAYAGPQQVKIQLQYVSDESTPISKPVLGVFAAQSFKVVQMNDARTLEDPLVVGECAARGGPVQVWTDDPVADFVTDATRHVLANWGVTVVNARPDFVLGVQVLHFFVHDDDMYDADVALRLRVETPDRQMVWQGQVRGAGHVAGRSLREESYNTALSRALAGALARFVIDGNVHTALLRPRATPAPQPVAATAEVHDATPEKAATGGAAAPLPTVPAVPGTVVVLHRPNGVPLVTQVAEAPKGDTAAAATPKDVTALGKDGFDRPSTLETPSAATEAAAKPPRPVSDAVLAGERESPEGTGLAAAAAAPATAPVTTPASAKSRIAVAHPGPVSAQDLLVELQKLKDAGASDPVLLAFLRQRTITGEITGDDLVAFKQAGFGDDVLKALLERGR